MIVTSKIIWESLSYHYDFPAQPFHCSIASTSQCYQHLINTLFLFSLSSSAKRQKASPHLQTNLHLFAFYSKGFLKPTPFFPFFFFSFTTEFASLFFTRHSQKTDRPLTNSTAVTGDLRANPLLAFTKRLFFPISTIIAFPRTADVFFFTISITINLPPIYLLHCFFTATLY